MEIKLPAGTFTIPALAGKKHKVLIVAGGKDPGKDWLNCFPEDYKIWAADHGADYCLAAGKTVDYLYGDKDSVNPRHWEKILTTEPEVKTFPVAKNDTDLALVLQDLPEESLVIATGIWGGRADHLFANIFSLLAAKKQASHTLLMADQEEIMLLMTAGDKATFTVDKKKAHAVSLLPLEEKNLVSIEGVKWPLNKAELFITHPYAISNEMERDNITVNCHKGSIGFYLNFKDGT